MNNGWGEPDDIEPFPDWMLPDSHPQKRINNSFEYNKITFTTI
jgi:hypothetical protein